MGRDVPSAGLLPEMLGWAGAGSLELSLGVPCAGQGPGHQSHLLLSDRTRSQGGTRTPGWDAGVPACNSDVCCTNRPSPSLCPPC